MRRLLAALFIAFAATAAHANALNIDPNQSGSISIGTNTSSPTQIFTNDPAATKTCVVNSSTNTVFFVGYSTTSAQGIGTNATASTNLTTGSFFLQGQLVSGATVQAQPFCFDGAYGPYTGPMWAVSATGGNVIQRIRTH